MKLVLESGNIIEKVEFKDMREFNDLILEFCSKNNVKSCFFTITGEALTKIIVDDGKNLEALFG